METSAISAKVHESLRGARHADYPRRVTSSPTWFTATVVGIAVVLSGCGGEDGPTAADRAAAKESESAASASVAAEASASASASESAEQQAEYDDCAARTRKLLEALNEMNSRLNIGLAYSDYGDRLGDIQVTYDNSIDSIVGETDDCLQTVGIPLENAFNKYIEVKNMWSNCIADYNCDFSEGEVNRKVQKRWADASKILERAEDNLEGMAPA